MFGIFSSGSDVAKPIDAVADGLDKLFTSDEERLTKEELLERTRQKPELMTARLDQLYAKSKFLFAAAARPFCVYIAGINAFNVTIGVVWFGKGHDIPEWFISMTATGFLGALGLYGSMRLMEKVKGVSK